MLLMHFEIIGDITSIETIAIGNSIRILPLLEEALWLGSLAKIERNCIGSSVQWYSPRCRIALV
jgi:hypothetical protein